MDETSILIIGGGVVGCAIAAEVSRHWQDVFLVEQFPKLGMSTSTRNSGVIHSGIYYKKDSLKARHCVTGNTLLKEYCVKNGVAHRTTGKLVVAKDASEEAELAALKKKGEDNGVEGLTLIDTAGIRKREPHITGHAALDVPSTGICISEDLVHAFARQAQAQGAHLVKHAKVTALKPNASGVAVQLEIGDAESMQTETIQARCVINSAGLYADEVANMLGTPRPWKIYPVRGEYCEVRGARASLINNLVYPLPHSHMLSLGVHFTKTLWDTFLLGPTATYVDGKDNYEKNRLPIADFWSDARTMLPELRQEDLHLAYSGLRPKLVPPDEHFVADFVIEPDKEYPQVIQLVGIESPGLTSAPSIAKHVAELAANVLN
jgi:glycerol-3-phosphate dehydrogenase